MKQTFKFLSLLSLICLAGCSNKQKTVDLKSYENMYDHLWNMWNRSLDGSDYDVAVYGDSRVAGGQFEQRFDCYTVVNLGVGGDKISHCIRRFKMIETTKPETVFLAIGGNDALSSSFDKEIFINEYNELLNLFKNLQIRVIMHSIPGLVAYGSIDQKTANKGNEKIAIANEEIYKIVEREKYELIDLAKLMNDSSGALKTEYTIDGCHFNEDGYSVWYSEMDNFLQFTID